MKPLSANLCEARDIEISEALCCPYKTHEMHNHHIDSTIWNDFRFREDDIIIATYAKSGTTWVQQIVGQLLFGPSPLLPISDMSPWLDFRFPEKNEKLKKISSQKHRRFIKTHLSVDTLVFSNDAKYIYIGRDPRDVVWSFYHHHIKANETWYRTLNETPGLIGPPMPRPTQDVRRYWKNWLHNDGAPFWPYWNNVLSWWNIRSLPNILFLHYSDMLKDAKRHIEIIANFIEVKVKENDLSEILKFCSFEWMKECGQKCLPLNGAFWNEGSKDFVNKGLNGRWRDVLTQSDIEEFESISKKKLGNDCCSWLMYGKS